MGAAAARHCRRRRWVSSPARRHSAPLPRQLAHDLQPRALWSASQAGTWGRSSPCRPFQLVPAACKERASAVSLFWPSAGKFSFVLTTISLKAWPAVRSCRRVSGVGSGAAEGRGGRAFRAIPRSMRRRCPCAAVRHRRSCAVPATHLSRPQTCWGGRWLWPRSGRAWWRVSCTSCCQR